MNYVYSDQSVARAEVVTPASPARQSGFDESIDTAESEQKRKQRREAWMESQGYVVDQPKTVWSRAKSLFGR